MCVVTTTLFLTTEDRQSTSINGSSVNITRQEEPLGDVGFGEWEESTVKGSNFGNVSTQLGVIPISVVRNQARQVDTVAVGFDRVRWLDFICLWGGTFFWFDCLPSGQRDVEDRGLVALVLFLL